MKVMDYPGPVSGEEAKSEDLREPKTDKPENVIYRAFHRGFKT
jgi:hypothetical protein